MAGFYGRITNDSKTSMTFDRVYPNKITMMNNASTDGVFVGRFVLVEYDSAIVDSNIAIGGSPEPNTSGEYDYYVSFYEKAFGENEMPSENNITISATTYSFLLHHLDLSSTKSDYSEYDTLTALVDGHHKNDVFKVYMLKYPNGTHWPDDVPPETIASNEHDRRRDAINEYVNENIIDVRYFMITENPNYQVAGAIDMAIPYKFTDITELVNTGENNAYNTNYNIDRLAYGTNVIGRGYDSTVWRKVIDSQGHHSYVMLAELNSVVPTFDLRVDAPTNVPVPPHFGADLSNVYYPLHIQSGWGFRIGKGEYGKTSDVSIDEYTSFEVNGNEIIQTPDSNFSNGYFGKIYWNKDGFNPKKSHKSGVSTEKNNIEMKPVASGKLYYGYDANHSLKAANDIQELSIYLPAIGDVVSDMYDLMYGNSKETPDDERYLDTSWEDANARKDTKRVQSRALTYYKHPGLRYTEKEYEDYVKQYNQSPPWKPGDLKRYTQADWDAYLNAHDNEIPNWTIGDIIDKPITREGFAPVEANSLAGTINSVHDMLGMVITASERPQDAIDAYADQIYYEEDENHEGTYYSVVEYPDYEPIAFEPEDFNLEPRAFKAKYQDRCIAYPHDDEMPPKPSLQKYTGGKYIKTDNSPTYERAPAPKNSWGGAQPGKIYYDLPERLIYAGDMISSQADIGYSWADNGRDLIPDEDGIFVVHNKDGEEVYQIQPNTEFFHSGKKYFQYAAGTSEYLDVTSQVAQAYTDDPARFEDEWVANGLYALGEAVVKVIDPSSTMYQIMFKDNNDTSHMQSISGLSSAAYSNHLSSEVDFITFLRQAIKPGDTIQGAVVQNVDYDHLYVASGIVQQNSEYIIRYTSVPVSKFLFAPLESGTSYYKDVYQRVTDSGITFYQRARRFTSEGSDDPTIVRVFTTKDVVYEDNKYWRIQIADELQDQELHNKKMNQQLTSINTADYDIEMIYKSRGGFVPNAIYWVIDGEDEAQSEEDLFTPVGYGIGSVEDHDKEDAQIEDPNSPGQYIANPNALTLYYAPNVLYYKNELGHYILADDDYEYVPGMIMYRVNELTVIDTGTAENLRLFARWNNDLIQSTEDINFFFNPETGHGVQLGHRFMSAAWKELPGFARNVNTLHGWIIKLNRLLNSEDVRTRDTSTMQGCINTMNDIIAKFDKLEPGGILGINKFGQAEAMTASGNDWITAGVSTNSQTGSPILTLAHNPSPNKNSSWTNSAAANTALSGGGLSGSSLTVKTISVDDYGHVTDVATSTYTLPSGLGAVSAGSGSWNASDIGSSLTITTDSWLDASASSSGLLFSHQQAQTATLTVGDASNQTPTFGGTFKALQVAIDANGHVSSLSEHNVTIPQGSLTDTTAGQIITALDFAPTTGAITVSTRSNVGDLALTGYTVGTSTASVEATDSVNTAIAKLQNQITAVGGQITDTSSTMSAAIGALTGSVLQLTGYAEASSISAMPIASDTINTGIQKLAYVLNNDTTPVNTRITNTISTLSAALTVTNSGDGLELTLTQSDGIVTALSGSIGAITYTPKVWNSTDLVYEDAQTTSTMTLADALALISELEDRIAKLEANV